MRWEAIACVCHLILLCLIAACMERRAHCSIDVVSPVLWNREMGFDPGVFVRFNLAALCAATP